MYGAHHLLRRLPSLSHISRQNMSSIPKRLTGKVAVVTASTDGIGYGVARRLAQEGAKVMVSSRKEANVQKAVAALQAEQLDVRGCVCHVGKPEDRANLLDKTISEFGQLDILVSNAAVNPHMGNILTSNSEHWDKLLDVNIKAAFLLCKDSLAKMDKARGGNIVLVSSIGGYVPFELIGPYSVCKTALLGLVKALAPAAARQNVRVNGIAPGIIKTHFSQALWQNEKIEKQTSKQVPLKRLGEPEDCAGPVAFLVSDDASYITGETIVIAGGMTAHL